MGSEQETSLGRDGGPDDHVRWTSVGLFILLAFGLDWLIEIGLRLAGVPFRLRALLEMFGPAAAAVVTRGLLREGYGDLGFRFRSPGGRGSVYLYAFVMPPMVLAAGILLALIVGEQHWALWQNIAVLRTHTPSGGTGRALPSPMAFIGIELLIALTIAPLINVILGALGEELGWRGHLLTRLLPLGEMKAAIVVGIVWGLWHAPVIVFDGYNYPGHPWIGPFFFCLFTVPLSVILSWLRLRSGSVFPPSIAHGAINAQAGFDLLALTRADPLVGPPTGIVGIIPFAAVAVWLVATRRVSAKDNRAVLSKLRERP